MSPTDVPLGASDLTLTVTGTGFVSGTAVQVNGVSLQTTFVSSTQVTAVVPAAQFKTGSVLPIAVSNGSTVVKADPAAVGLSVNNPVPSLASVAPGALPLGAGDTTVTVTGTNFVPGVALAVNGTPRTTTFVSNTQLTAQLAAADFATAQSLPLSVTNPKPGGGTSSAATLLSVNNPAPAATSVSPASVTAGSAATTFTVTGSGLLPSTTVQINGATRSATVLSGTQLTFTLSDADLATATTLAVQLSNPQPGGGSSAGVSIPVNNPVPAIAGLSPVNVSTGAADTVVTINGTGFVPATTLQVNGTARAVTYVSNKQLSVKFAAAELTATTTYNLVLTNGAPGGGTSNAAPFTVGTQAPVITSLSPATLPVSSPATTVTINGTGFLPATTVTVAGYPHSATYVSSTQMTLPLTVNDLSTDGNYLVSATNPINGVNVTGRGATFTVQAKPAVLTAVSPSTLVVNGGPYILIVNGTNLSYNSKLLWNGTQIPSSYYNVYNPGTGTYSYALQGTVSNDLVGSTGTASITATNLTNSTPSNTLTVTIGNPPVPTVTGLSPNYAPVNADVKLTINGTGFTKSSVASYNGTALTTTYNSATYLNATVPASLLTLPGNGSVTVSTPTPGGGTSTGAVLTTFLPIASNNMVFNKTNGLAYLSIPGTGSTVAGTGANVAGNSIVSLDPATGALGTPIFVGSEPGVMAVSDDGTTLWVALNGTVAIRKVDLVKSVAGAQYSVSALGNTAATAILVLPGTTDSVAVTNGNMLGLYDAGVLRGSTVSVSGVYALQADGSRSELYTGGYALQNYTYGTAGLTLKASNSNSQSNSFASSNYDEMQVVSGKLFTDLGRVYDSESAGLLGTFSVSSTSSTSTFTVSGPTLYDAALSQVYVVNNGVNSGFSGYNQVTLFDPSSYANTGKSFQWNVPYNYSVGTQSFYLSPHRLSRWGANGLLLHTKYAIFTAQSNVVKDQSSVSADLSAAVAVTGGTATGSTATYTVTVTNSGPQSATDVALSLVAPGTGVITSTTSGTGTCISPTGCTFGTLASNGTATATVSVLQTTAGTGTLSAYVQGSSTDPVTTNNTASAAVTVTGSPYNLQPTLSTLSPNAVKAGGADTTLTVTGTNFASGSQVMLGSTALATTYVSSTQLTATVPAANTASMGWNNVSVSSPAPGGGNSGSLPLTVFSVTTVGLNHIVYEPYSRKLYASVSSGSSTVTGSSVVSIDPTTGAFGTPITFATTPGLLALSTTGNTLYAGLNVADTSSLKTPLGRIDLAKATADTINVPMPSGYYGAFGWNSLAMQPGADDTIATSRTNGQPTLYDYAASTKTLTQRGSQSSAYYGTCLNFLDSSNLLSTYSAIFEYPVTAAGLGTYKTLSTYVSECFQLAGNVALTPSGKVVQLTPTNATQLGTLALPYNSFYYTGTVPGYSLDPSLGDAFIPAPTNSLASNYAVTGLISYDLRSFLRTGSIDLGIPSIEGSNNSSVAINDLVRWGQDGLAMVTSTGHLYLLRGPFVVPGELAANTAATLSTPATTTYSTGTGNTLLTLTGTNFQPGVAVTWNGTYRTTTRISGTQVTVAIPASDLAASGTGKLVATNPNASASNTLTITVQ